MTTKNIKFKLWDLPMAEATLAISCTMDITAITHSFVAGSDLYYVTATAASIIDLIDALTRLDKIVVRAKALNRAGLVSSYSFELETK